MEKNRKLEKNPERGGETHIMICFNVLQFIPHYLEIYVIVIPFKKNFTIFLREKNLKFPNLSFDRSKGNFQT